MTKRKQVLVAINTLTSIAAGPYRDHMRLFYRLGRDYRQFDFHQMVGQRMSIDRFRNMAARICLDNRYDYLFFIDDDMYLPPDTFGALYKARMDIIMAHVYIRGYPFEIMAFKGDEFAGKNKMVSLTQEDLTSSKVRKDGVIPCSAIGTAVSLINVKTTIAKVPAPWFVTGQYNTEDIYFCCKCRDYNKKTTIGMHTKVITGHMLDQEVISAETRQHLLDYHQSYLTADQIASDKEGKGDRGEQYIKENVESLISAKELMATQDNTDKGLCIENSNLGAGEDYFKEAAKISGPKGLKE